jgi:Flp pilus assembly protein TadG
MVHISEKQFASTRRHIMTHAVRRLVNCRRGTTAIEFAFIAPIFFALLFAILETGLVFFNQQAIQTAATQSARLIMTGQVQSQGLTAAQFKQTVCANLNGVLNCSGVYVNVQKYSSFSTVSMLNPVSNRTFNGANMNFNPGNSGDIVVLQLFYQWPVGPKLLGVDLSNVNGGNLLLVGTAAFRNEPYH